MDPGFLQVPLRLFDAFVRGMNALGSLWILGIMVLLTADVIGRYLFNSPITGVPLVITMSLIAIVFLQLPDALLAGRVTRNGAVISRVTAAKPKLGHSLTAFYCVVSAAFMALIAWYSLPFFEKAWRTGSYLGNRGDFTLPDWPFKLLIVLGAVVTMIQYLRLAWANVRAARGLPAPELDVQELESLE